MNQQATHSSRFAPITLLWAVLALCALLLSGCSTPEERAMKRLENTPAYRPTNIYSAPTLPDDIRRVAILPVSGNIESVSTHALLQQQVAQALTRTNRFEAIAMSSDELARLFGRTTLTATEVLPNNFFAELKSLYAADAVLFTELVHYDAYQPMQLGFRMNLISVKDGESLWAFDDVFDSGDARVSSGALKHQEMQGTMLYPMNNPSTVLSSPSKFASYAFSTAFSTLPARGTNLDTVTVTRDYAQNPNEQPVPSDQTSSNHPEIPNL